jgi:leader peptidase (prepilin peptidase)/N-methyltransferase
MPLLLAFAAVFGAIAGSFLNALLWRLHAGESVAKGRSHCVSCNVTLAARDLVPVLSWAWLRGRCRSCRAPIGVSYVLIELVTAALFVLAVLKGVPSVDGVRAGFSWGGTDFTLFGAFTAVEVARLLLDWFCLAALLAVFVYDQRHMLIPREITMPATVVALAGGLMLGVSPFSLATGMLLAGGLFWAQHAASRGRWIGGGDIHLGALMGAILGLRLTAAALLLAYVAGAAYGLAVIALGRKKWNSEVPFGTFLAAAAAAMLLWGEPLVTWYLALLS